MRYIYVQNNIVHILRPTAPDYGMTKKALANVLAKLFFSLKSEIIK